MPIFKLGMLLVSMDNSLIFLFVGLLFTTGGVIVSCHSQIRQLSKPVANVIKQRAVERPAFKKMCHDFAQVSTNLEFTSRCRLRLLRKSGMESSRNNLKSEPDGSLRKGHQATWWSYRRQNRSSPIDMKWCSMTSWSQIKARHDNLYLMYFIRDLSNSSEGRQERRC